MCKDEQKIGEDQVSEAIGSLTSGQDPGIKLFGRVISALNGSENEDEGDVSGCNNEELMCPRMEFDHSSKEVPEQQVDENRASTWVSEELGSSSGSFSGCEDDKTAGEDLSPANGTVGSPEKPIVSKLCATERPSEIEREQDASTKLSEETTPRKPDKPVPCPRCDSLDTKFCYFNNYNVNQPRHFCKQCQRYWTAGGTLRNVPVGAGRRKHKHPSLQQNNQQQSTFDCLTVRRNESDSAQQLIAPSFPQIGHQPTQAFLPILPADRSINNSAASASTITTFKEEIACPGSSSNNSSRSSSAFKPKYSGSSIDLARPIAQGKGADVFSASTVTAVGGYYMNTNAMLQSPQSLSTISSEVSNGSKNSKLEEPSRAAKQVKSPEERHSGSYVSASPEVDRKEGERHSLHDVPTPIPAPAPTDPFTWQQRARPSDAGLAGWMNAAAPFCFFNGPWPSPYVFNPGWSPFPQSHVPGPFYNPSAAAVAAPSNQMLLGYPWCHPSMWPPGSWNAPPVWTPTMPWEAAAAAVAAAAAAAAAASAVSAGNSNLGKHQRDGQALPEGRIESPLWLPKTLRMDDQGEEVRSSILASLGLADASSSQYPLSQKDMQKPFVAECAGAAASDTRHANPAAAIRSVAFQESN